MELSRRSPDIDRGWAFVAMAGSGLVEMLSMSFTFCSAVIYSELLDEFESSPSTVAWAVNLNGFCTHAFGELANIFIQLVGIRNTITIGCILSSVGMIACSFAPTLLYVLVFHGIITGIGFSMTLIPSFEIITRHFIRRRKIAFAVRSSGASIGGMIFPPIFRILFDEYHWRGAFLILAAINLHQLLAAAAAIPPRLIDETEQHLLQSSSPKESKKQSILFNFRQLVSNFSMFSQVRFCFFISSFIFTSIGIGAFTTHITNYALLKGHSKLASSLLPSLIGITSLFMRLTVGVLAQRLKLHVIGLHVIFMTALGLVSILFGFLSAYSFLAICTILFGTFLSVLAIWPEVIIFVTGVDRVTSGVSYGCISIAIGFLLGGPLAGWVYEIDPTYRWSFIIIGSITMIGGLMNLPSWIDLKEGRLTMRKSYDLEML